MRIHEDPVVAAFLRRHVPSPATFVSRIDEDDEMFLFDLKTNNGDRRRTAIGYYTLGARIFSAIRQIAAWRFDGLESVRSFLDFASGYGRSTRFLTQQLSPSRVWASDIYASAVDFQKRHYGVHGIVSVSDPARFPKDREFDYIFASSFFTHVPRKTFGGWLRALHDRLSPGGILAFSTHDFSLIPPSVTPPDAGIFFARSSESRTLPKHQYGTTYVTEGFVREAVEGATAGKGRLHRIPRGLCHFQDIYILADRLNRDFSALTFLHDPVGHIDYWREAPDGAFELTGWAADFNVGGSITAVTFSSGDRIINTVPIDHDRPDVARHFECPTAAHSGFRCRISRQSLAPEDVFEVTATNHVGTSAVIACDYPDAIRRRCHPNGSGA